MIFAIFAQGGIAFKIIDGKFNAKCFIEFLEAYMGAHLLQGSTSDFGTMKLQPYIRIWTPLRSASDFFWLHKVEVAFVYPGSLV